jgi:Methylase involved in ubiquinone/menaquinone biosynthesis
MTIAVKDVRDEKRMAFFENAAERWEDKNYNPDTQARVKNLLQSLNLPAGKKILDVGCGRGVLIPYLREIMGADATIIALDSSATMLAGVAEKDSQVETIHARAEEIPLPDSQLDLLICFSAFPHIHDQAAAAAEFHRVLAPGGTAYILHLRDSKRINMHHDKHEAVKGDHLPDAKTMKQMFLHAGFQYATLEEDPEKYLFVAKK